MIARKRPLPLKILATEALLRRLQNDVDNRLLIEKDLARRKAGRRGEESSDYYVHKLPDKDFTILHDLRLSNGQDFFQIDTLIISPTFALIMEIKNISGTIYFDSKFKQLIRYKNDQEDGFLDPIAQAERQKKELGNWLAQRNFVLPIEFLVVISNPSTIVKTDSQNYRAFKYVIHAHEIIDRVGKIKTTYREENLKKRDIQKLARILIKSHTPETFNILDHYKISADHLKTGVYCSKCKLAKMDRVYGQWQCTVCQYKDKAAHQNALLDYRLLIGTSITNEQFREFLQISSPDVAKRLLNSMKLPYSGWNKGRIYHLHTLLNEEN